MPTKCNLSNQLHLITANDVPFKLLTVQAAVVAQTFFAGRSVNKQQQVRRPGDLETR